MFTGIVTNQAKVIRKEKLSGQIHFKFQFLKKDSRKIEIGESVAVDGVCLTATAVFLQGFEADAVSATLNATTLGLLAVGSLVNTERSLQYGDSIGGHFVTGHVDGISKILSIEKKGKNLLYEFSLPGLLAPLVAPKGSVVIDGISLTVQSVASSSFQVAIVPHTWKVTSLGRKKSGSHVNLEVDLVARYLKRAGDVLKTSGKRQPKTISVKKLKAAGF